MNSNDYQQIPLVKRENFKQDYCFLKRFWLFQEARIDWYKMVPNNLKKEISFHQLEENGKFSIYFDFICILIHK